MAENHAAAVRWFRSAAERGHAGAQYNLALCYSDGVAVPEDHSQKVAWLRKAVQQDHTGAQAELGRAYEVGSGVAQDAKRAAELYRQAAQKGLARAQYLYGRCLEYGVGVAANVTDALKWYSAAATQGNVDAALALGICYLNGADPEKDRQAALDWLRQAAESGDAVGQFNYGVSIADSDPEQAVSWYRKAAAQGMPEAQTNLAIALDLGKGAHQDHAEALHWYGKAIQNGSAAAQLNLATMSTEIAQDGHPLSSWYAAFESPGTRIHCMQMSHLEGPFINLANSSFGQAVRCVLTVSPRCIVVIKAPRDQRISWLLLNEFVALQRIPPHPNLLTLIGACQDFKYQDSHGDSQTAPISFVFPFIEHGSIVDYFKDHTHAGDSTRFLLPWLLDVAKVLAHLHGFSVVHRDLAARNVFIDANHVAVVGDLGMTRPESEAKIDDQQPALGTRQPYLFVNKEIASPAHFEGGEYTTASDVFSFGLLLFDLATECKHNATFSWHLSSNSAQRAFAKREAAALNGYPNLVSKLPAAFPQEIVHLMLRCLAFKASKRPVAGEIVNALQNIPKAKADTLRIEGNSQFEHKNFADALRLYEQYARCRTLLL